VVDNEMVKALFGRGPGETGMMQGDIVAGSGKKWLVGCGVGCGAVMLLGILLTVGLSFKMMQPFDKAIDAQNELETEFGPRESYIPPPQGITPDRLEKFIAVRRSLVPLCEEFREIGDSFQAMEDLDKDGQEPSKGEAFKAVGNVMGNVFGLIGNLGRYTEQRNLALLEQEMSLGEYIWIYVLVYNSWLGQEPNQDFDDREGRGYSSGERKLLRNLMLNHTEALVSAGMVDQAETWKDEAGVMARAEYGVPFRDSGLPGSYVQQFLPYEEELEALFCDATSSFELNRMKKKGLSITAD
jgi:hypothetical protein